MLVPYSYGPRPQYRPTHGFVDFYDIPEKYKKFLESIIEDSVFLYDIKPISIIKLTSPDIHVD